MLEMNIQVLVLLLVAPLCKDRQREWTCTRDLAIVLYRTPFLHASCASELQDPITDLWTAAASDILIFENIL